MINHLLTISESLKVGTSNSLERTAFDMHGQHVH